MISNSGETLRVAFFPDTYDEVDGVANTSRQFEAFARRRGLPFLVINGVTGGRYSEHYLARLAFPRGSLSFALDKRHDFDLAFCRHLKPVEDAVREFDPDILHITGPSDVGILGTVVAQRLHIPLAASWHTNLHQYAQQRSNTLLRWLPRRVADRTCAWIRDNSLWACLRFYHIAQILYAPNPELVTLLERGTGKSCFLMERGVDTDTFDPARRNRNDNVFRIGFVGRLTVEKNVRMLVDLERALIQAGLTNFRVLIVGQGAEDSWLRANLQSADFAGVLHGPDLGRAYANMDVFVFPSLTDTYGNVVLEALAAGVPAVVSDGGGPRFIVRTGETGFIARNLGEFRDRVHDLARQTELLSRMRMAARQQALAASWDKVFENVYAGYERGLRGVLPSDKRLRRIRTGAFARVDARMAL